LIPLPLNDKGAIVGTVGAIGLGVRDVAEVHVTDTHVADFGAGVDHPVEGGGGEVLQAVLGVEAQKVQRGVGAQGCDEPTGKVNDFVDAVGVHGDHEEADLDPNALFTEHLEGAKDRPKAAPA
jgi:hypothetical protein